MLKFKSLEFKKSCIGRGGTIHKIFFGECYPTIYTSFYAELKGLSEKIFWEVVPLKNFMCEKDVLTTEVGHKPILKWAIFII